MRWPRSWKGADNLSKRQKFIGRFCFPDESTADDHFALAELLYLGGDLSAARERYYVAIELDEDFVEARSNLGCVLAEQGELGLAESAFRGALEYHPDYADAHYHLARLLDRTDRSAEASPHWQLFMSLAPASPWADEARERLAGRTGHSDSGWRRQGDGDDGTENQHWLLRPISKTGRPFLMREILVQYEPVNPTTWAYLASLLMIAVYFKFNRIFSVRNLDLMSLVALSPALLMVQFGRAHANPIVEHAGYIWLFAVSGLFLLRLLLDTMMVRRPLLEPNLSVGGLSFLGLSLFVFLMANVVTASRRQRTWPARNVQPIWLVGGFAPMSSTACERMAPVFLCCSCCRRFRRSRCWVRAGSKRR